MKYNDEYEERYAHHIEEVKEGLKNGKFVVLFEKFEPEIHYTAGELIDVLKTLDHDEIIGIYQHFPGQIYLKSSKNGETFDIATLGTRYLRKIEGRDK